MQKRWERMEKRVDQRYNIPMRAFLSFTDAATQDLKTLNISSGAAFIMTNQAKPEGTEVFMSLFSQGTKVFISRFMNVTPTKQAGERISIKFRGVVKRRYNFGMAVGFDNQYCID